MKKFRIKLMDWTSGNYRSRYFHRLGLVWTCLANKILIPFWPLSTWSNSCLFSRHDENPWHIECDDFLSHTLLGIETNSFSSNKMDAWWLFSRIKIQLFMRKPLSIFYIIWYLLMKTGKVSIDKQKTSALANPDVLPS